MNTTKDYTKRLYLDQVFPQSDGKPTKSGSIVRFCSGLVAMMLCLKMESSFDEVFAGCTAVIFFFLFSC